MLVKTLDQLQKLNMGDHVHATFSDISGNVTEATGHIDHIDTSTIGIKDQETGQVKEFALWRMLSLVSIERDISFVREGNIMSDLEHVAFSLEGRLQRTAELNTNNRKNKKNNNPRKK